MRHKHLEMGGNNYPNPQLLMAPHKRIDSLIFILKPKSSFHGPEQLNSTPRYSFSLSFCLNLISYILFLMMPCLQQIQYS